MSGWEQYFTSANIVSESYAHFVTIPYILFLTPFAGTIAIGGLLLDPEQLRQIMSSQNISLTPEAIETLLNASVSAKQANI